MAALTLAVPTSIPTKKDITFGQATRTQNDVTRRHLQPATFLADLAAWKCFQNRVFVGLLQFGPKTQEITSFKLEHSVPFIGILPF